MAAHRRHRPHRRRRWSRFLRLPRPTWRLSRGLNVGDCIDEPAGTSDITDVQHQPCNEPHDGEVFAVINHTAASGTPYPPSTEFQDLVSEECLPALEAYTARTYAEVYAAGLDVSFLYPSSESWSDGDREV